MPRERKLTNWKEIFAIQMFYQTLFSKIYKEQFINKQKPTTSIKNEFKNQINNFQQ